MAKKVTSDKVASTASKVLRDGRYSKDAKSTAGSALSQKEKDEKEKKAKSNLRQRVRYSHYLALFLISPNINI